MQRSLTFHVVHNSLAGQEHLYSTMLTSGQVLVGTQGPPDVTAAVVEALRLQWAYGFPYTPQVSSMTSE